MTSSTRKMMKEIEGFQYHQKTKALHLRLDKHQVLSEIALLFRDRNLPLLDCETLHLSIGENLMEPRGLQFENSTQNYFFLLCQAIGDSLQQLKEVQVGRALCGFLHSTNAGAWCPIDALQALLEKTPGTLQTFVLRNLQLYSVRQQQLEEVTAQQPQDTSVGAIDILSNCLTGHPSLLRFGWQHCEVVPRAPSLCLDPLLQTFSTMPKLRDIVVHSPSWSNLVQTDPNALTTLVGSTVQGLHLDGLQLDNEHLRNILLSPSSLLNKQQQMEGPSHCSSLHNLSLFLELTLDNVQDLACTMGRVLQSVPLRQLTLRLKWKGEDSSTASNDSEPVRKQKIRALQSFQDTIASALLNCYDLVQHSKQPQEEEVEEEISTAAAPMVLALQRLDIIYYDSSYRWDMTPPVLCPHSFQKVLERNFQLTHLRLPYCGEMNPFIDFLLKLNRTGLRQHLLAPSSTDDKDSCNIHDTMDDRKSNSCNERLLIQGLLQIQTEQPKVCWNASPRKTTTMPLSMMYYLLREMPEVFLREDHSSNDDTVMTKNTTDTGAEMKRPKFCKPHLHRQIPKSLFTFLLLSVLTKMTAVEGFLIPSRTSKSMNLASSDVSLSPKSASPVSTSQLFASTTTTAKGEASEISNSGGGSGSYIRWRQESSSSPNSADVWSLQTAVTTFQRTNRESKKQERIELHAQVHLGDKDYFDYYNTAEFSKNHDEVLYELLVDEDLLGLSKDKSGRALTQHLQASPNDQSVASGYEWQCQVDVIDYTQDNWKHADFTRQEMLHQQPQSKPIDDSRPLWQQIGNKSGSAFWQPAVSALFVGPPSLFVSTDNADFFSDSPSIAKRKLFTNLFLPGNQFAGWLRAILWVTVPAPEISVLLLDWSSLFLSRSSAKFSPVTLPILQSLMTLQVAQLRRLVFGQVLVAGNSAQQSQSQRQQQSQDWMLLVTQRNDHALQVLQSSLRKQGSKRMALLYGCSHCPDLHTKLVRDLGFTATKTEWRNAWSVSVPKTFSNEENSDNVVTDDITAARSESIKGGSTIWEDLSTNLPPTAWAALVMLFPLYLSVGAIDWIDTIHSSAVSLLDEHDSLAFSSEWFLYLLRHVLLYVGVSKFALEWQDPNSGNRNNASGG